MTPPGTVTWLLCCSFSISCHPQRMKISPGDAVDKMLVFHKRAFTAGDPAELRSVQKELKRSLKESKDAYRKKLEERLERNQIRDVWSGMRTITGFQKKGIRSADGNVDQANELNQFFNRAPNTSANFFPLPPADTVWLNTALLSDTDNRQDSPGNEQNRIVGDRQGRDREEGRQGLPGSRQ
ncbi:hypothetical protein D4764_0194770, partial [Takifugu flavidus]